MLICKKCKAEIVCGACKVCGKKKTGVEATDSDEIYLTSSSFMFKNIVEDTLNDAGIAFVAKGSLGSGISAYIGNVTETFNFYVMLKDYDNANSVISCLNTEMTDEELEAYVDSLEENEEN